MVKTLEDAETQAAVKAAMNQYNHSVIGDEMRRSQECMQKVQELLKEYNCVIVPRCTLSPQGVEFMLETVAKPPGATTGAGKKAMGYSTPLPGAPNASKAGQMSKKSKGRSGQKRKKG